MPLPTPACWTASIISPLLAAPFSSHSVANVFSSLQQQQAALENYTEHREGSDRLTDGFSLVYTCSSFGLPRLPPLPFFLEGGGGGEVAWKRKTRIACEAGGVRLASLKPGPAWLVHDHSTWSNDAADEDNQDDILNSWKNVVAFGATRLRARSIITVQE